MSQKRYFIKTVNGVETPICRHTAREVLEFEYVELHKDEKAKRNHVYHNTNGDRVSYRPVTKDVHDKMKAEQYAEMKRRNDEAWAKRLESAKLAEVDEMLDSVDAGVTKLETSMTTLGEEISAFEAKVRALPEVELFTAPAPSRNSQRGKGNGALFKVIETLQQRVAKAERRVMQQEALLNNARIREMELRHNVIHGGGYGSY